MGANLFGVLKRRALVIVRFLLRACTPRTKRTGIPALRGGDRLSQAPRPFLSAGKDTSASMNDSLSTSDFPFLFSDFSQTCFWELFSRTLEHLFEVPPLSRGETAGPVMK